MKLMHGLSPLGIDVALQFEARKVALKQDRTGFVLTLAIHPDECPEEILRDFVGARYACAVVRIQDDESPTHYDNRVQKAGMLCREENFQMFLGVDNENDAASKLCKRCGINSRTELHGNATAQDYFDKLIARYEKTKAIDDPF
jgi:hypothetical protein